MIFAIAAAVVAAAYLDHSDEAALARLAWDQAVAVTEPSVSAKTLLARIERRESIIIAEHIASADSFQAVKSRLNALWAEYCRLEDERLAAGLPDLGTARPGEL